MLVLVAASGFGRLDQRWRGDLKRSKLTRYAGCPNMQGFAALACLSGLFSRLTAFVGAVAVGAAFGL
jgi:hypothetical protein